MEKNKTLFCFFVFVSIFSFCVKNILAKGVENKKYYCTFGVDSEKRGRMSFRVFVDKSGKGEKTFLESLEKSIERIHFWTDDKVKYSCREIKSDKDL